MNIRNPKYVEFFRFCLVGVVATILHYGIYLLLLKVFKIDSQIGENVAYSIGYLLSWCANLWLTAKFTFKEKVTVKRGIGFAVSHAVNYVLHLLFLNLFLSFGVSSQVAPIPVYCIVVPINFLLVRTVFKKLN